MLTGGTMATSLDWSKTNVPGTVENALYELVAFHEGFTAHVTEDIDGRLKIGHSSTWHRGMPTEMTREQARPYLIADLQNAQKFIDKNFSPEQLAKYAQSMPNLYASLISMAQNLSSNGARKHLEASQLFKLIKEGGLAEDIQKQISRWNKAGGSISDGIVKRRLNEGLLAHHTGSLLDFQNRDTDDPAVKAAIRQAKDEHPKPHKTERTLARDDHAPKPRRTRHRRADTELRGTAPLSPAADIAAVTGPVQIASRTHVPAIAPA